MSVYKNPKTGYYEYSFAIQRHRVHGSTGLTNRREAEAEEQRHRERKRAEINAAQAGHASLTMDDVCERYWHDIGQHHAGSANTDRLLGWLVNYFGETWVITEITHDAAAAMVAKRRLDIVPYSKPPRFIANATVNVTLKQLKKLISYCKARGVEFKHEPKWKELWLREPQERVRELHDDEAERLDAAMRDDYAPLFDYVRATGKRKSECFNLKWSEVHWDTQWIERLGKGGRRVRVRITPAIREILWPLVGHHPEYVFTYVAPRTMRRGRSAGQIKGQRYPINAEALNKLWQRIKKKAAIGDFRFHDFRHDFATKLLRNTGNLKLVSKALDHASITPTMRYAHVHDEEVGAAVEALATKRRKNHPTNHPTKAIKVA